MKKLFQKRSQEFCVISKEDEKAPLSNKATMKDVAEAAVAANGVVPNGKSPSFAQDRKKKKKVAKDTASTLEPVDESGAANGKSPKKTDGKDAASAAQPKSPAAPGRGAAAATAAATAPTAGNQPSATPTANTPAAPKKESFGEVCRMEESPYRIMKVKTNSWQSF